MIGRDDGGMNESVRGVTTRESRTKLSRQLEIWRRDLVSLDRRQRMLYFHHTKSASFEVVAPDPAAALQLAESGDLVVMIDDESSVRSRQLRVSDKTEQELRSGLRRLDQQAHQVFADRGVWTLYLAFGMLEWSDPQDQTAVSTPILLAPVALQRSGVDAPFTVHRTEDEVVLNPILALKMERDFGIVLPELDPDDFDVDNALADVGAAVLGKSGWTVSERTVLTSFSFHKEAMYQDLKDNEASILDSSLVQLVGLGPESPSADQFAFDPVDDDDLETAVPPEQLFNVLDADSSQRRCILAARDGRSFVMDGPPGTGKSQTIANIIAELMAAGRTVLFVSEKAAALDVVRKRLEEVQLASFLLELHSSSITRKQFAEIMGNALRERVRLQSTFTSTDVKELEQARRGLNDYAAAVNEVRQPLGRSLFWAMGKLATLHELSPFKLPRNESWAGLDASTYAQVLRTAESLGRAWAPVSRGEDFLWRDLAADTETGDADQCRRESLSAQDSARLLASVIAGVDEDLALAEPSTAGAAEKRRSLLELLEQRPEAANAVHLTVDDLASVIDRAAEIKTTTASYLAGVQALTAAAGSRWHELSPQDAHVLIPVERGNALWATTGRTPASALIAALGGADQFPGVLTSVADDTRGLAAMFGVPGSGLTANRAADLHRLAQLTTSQARPLPEWLNPTRSAALQESARILNSLVASVIDSEAQIRSEFTTAALDLDLGALHTRMTTVHKGLHRLSTAARADRRTLRAVAVRGRVDKQFVGALPHAIVWQQAHRALTRAESDHAADLGVYYNRTETDFTRLAAALAVARESLELVGQDLDPSALAGQLGMGAVANPHVLLLAQRVSQGLTHLDELVTRSWGDRAREWLRDQPFDAAVHAATELGALIRDVSGVTAVVSDVCGRDCTVEEATALLERAGSVASDRSELDAARDAAHTMLGPGYQDTETDWPALDAALAWALAVRTLTGGAIPESVVDRARRPAISSGVVSSALARWVQDRDRLLARFRVEHGASLRRELDADLSSVSDLLAEMANAAPSEVPEWVAHSQYLDDAQKLGVGPVVDVLVASTVKDSEVAPAVDRALVEAWAEAEIKADTRLRALRATDRDALVETFRTLDKRLVADTRARVMNACNARRPRSAASYGAQLIQREAAKKSRHKPIRHVLSEAGEVALELKPCFMMSPLAVSQFVPSDLRFDVVIFDEASQVLPSDAINCIYRGAQLIVAGDKKQLPPTTFFSTGASEDEIDDDEDDQPAVFDSVLDLCKAAGAMPSLPLTWHYRSAHESLIAFSNYRFYKGELFTFPGARQDGDDLGLHSILVDGVYRRGSSRDNPVEARKVVERILHHAERHPDLSLGVVTFSTAQEDAVFAEIERSANAHPVLMDLLNSHDRLDGFFVKNLESVQGDERDIIIFSVGYGPDEAGKITANFGPLTRDGGWRRLNVAITRARRRVEVISSFGPSALRATGNLGADALLGYIDYAQRGTEALALDLTDSQGDAESPFEEAVITEIRAMGYEAVPQVGTAGYRIDIGVRHPLEPGRYLLGVECDGAAYHSSKVARDRDRLREEVLRRLGWRIHRIWGPSWWRDRATQIERLRQALADAAADSSLPFALPREAGAIPAAEIEVEEVDLSAPPTWGEPYTVCDGHWTLPCEPGAPEAPACLRKPLGEIIWREAPLHEVTLYDRLRDGLGIGRVGSLIRANVKLVLASTAVNDHAVEHDKLGFIRLNSFPLKAPRYPTGDPRSQRKPAAVPPEELRMVLALSVGDAKVAEEPALARALAQFFGWNVTAEVARLTSQALERAVHLGELTKRDGFYRLTS